jgi:enhancer of polycomb-like protein
MMDGGRTPVAQEEKTVTKLPIRYVSPPVEPQGHGMTLRPSYRRRQGRGGRLFIDRRGLKRQRLDDDEEDEDEDEEESHADSPPSPSRLIREIRKGRKQDRAAYDLDSDEDTQVYFTDPYDDWNIKYRIAFGYSPSRSNQEQVEMQRKMLEDQQRRHQQAAAQAGANGARAALPAAQTAAG